MHLKTFSVYGNFVESDAIGCPTHSERYGSWNHLSKLLVSASEQINSGTKSEGSTCSATEPSCNGHDSEETFSTSAHQPLSIVGFSKGCVVLNQLVHELKYAKENPELKSFVRRVSHMYWLDGGHNGGSKTWITDPEVLKGLTGTKIEVRIHVTPYQVKDAMRNWIGQEHKKFVQNLRKLGIPVFDTIHFNDEERSLENHFNVLHRF